ncbi:hypothetical protein HJG60_008726 [Phyllostomus discolor]|uniref:Uncharacterized protein n=1 Tax=Phyllostomus discolor TaxID=89673 RepID=A0A833YW65_9CHIR|nr:hypothetical protein HJG60_008726 [Phyllostomus discolor]
MEPECLGSHQRRAVQDNWSTRSIHCGLSGPVSPGQSQSNRPKRQVNEPPRPPGAAGSLYLKTALCRTVWGCLWACPPEVPCYPAPGPCIEQHLEPWGSLTPSRDLPGACEQGACFACILFPSSFQALGCP